MDKFLGFLCCDRDVGRGGLGRVSRVDAVMLWMEKALKGEV